MPHSSLSPTLVLILALVSCAQPADTPSKSQPAETTGASAPGPAVDDAGFDLATLDICARVPLSEVAAIYGAPSSAGTAQATMGKWATDCTYSFQRDGSSDFAIVYAYSPSLWMPGLDDEATEITGLGDAAYATESAGSFHQVHVLAKGLVYLDARADTPEQALALAELALNRLTGASTGP